MTSSERKDALELAHKRLDYYADCVQASQGTCGEMVDIEILAHALISLSAELDKWKGLAEKAVEGLKFYAKKKPYIPAVERTGVMQVDEGDVAREILTSLSESGEKGK